MATGAELEQLRASVRPLLDDRSPADALASYYTLHHPADRTEMVVHAGTVRHDGAAGFLVRARTGMDLFRPLVTFRADGEVTARALVERGLVPGRPVYLTVPESHAQWANKLLAVSEAEVHRLYRFNPDNFVRQFNVLVVTTTGADGLPRCEIRQADRPGAVAGINWQSPRFAEIYVYTEAAVRGRGWGKAVVRALVESILNTGRAALYVVAESNQYSIRLAEAVGFEDTGFREFVGQAVYSVPNPNG